MTLLRAVPRAMLASYFVASGIKAIRDPESLVPAAEPLADRVVPLVKQYSPEQVASVVPENTVTKRPWPASQPPRRRPLASPSTTTRSIASMTRP